MVLLTPAASKVVLTASDNPRVSGSMIDNDVSISFVSANPRVSGSVIAI